MSLSYNGCIYVLCGIKYEILSVLYLFHYRRAPLTAYMCTEALYAVFYALKSRGIVTPLPHGEVRYAGVHML